MKSVTSLGPLMIDLVGTTITPAERELLLSPLVGGVILFARQFESKAQIKELVAQLRALRNPRLLIAVDHEGGRVQRFRTEFTVIPPMSKIGECYQVNPHEGQRLAFACGRIIGSELLEVGIDLNFGPVLDISHPHSQVLAGRTLSDNPKTAVLLAEQIMLGMQEAGMKAVGKHFPGHGGVKEDSHLECPTDTRMLTALCEADLAVFAQMIPLGLPAVMTAHIVFPEIDTQPVTFSSTWLKKILRQDLHFSGIIFSDDLTMQAVAEGSYASRVERALAAGCDITLVCNAHAHLAPLFADLAPVKFADLSSKISALYGNALCHDKEKAQEAHGVLQHFLQNDSQLA